MKRKKRRHRAVTARQEEVLSAVRALVAAGEDVSATALAARLGILRAAATRHLKSLERKGLVRDIPKTVSSGKWQLV